MRRQRLQWICTLGVIVGHEQVAYAVVKCVVEAALALEGVSLAEGAGLEEKLYDFEVAAEASLT